MTRAVAAFGALLITSVLLLLAVTGVSWFMNSPAVWAIARMRWFTPTVIALNSFWITIWVPLYVSYAHRKKSSAEKIETFR